MKYVVDDTIRMLQLDMLLMIQCEESDSNVCILYKALRKNLSNDNCLFKNENDIADSVAPLQEKYLMELALWMLGFNLY